ncbi:DEAD/DEAH box helicase family protein [Candidatus Woesearchaeota archaeon]|nr:DEAD/DEAH box helicase family protein [Candidatus Woesearchaeota archaeon]
MSLKKLDLKHSYDSDEDDILNQFYIPVLSESIRYDRIAGYFSSTSLALAASGIAKFVWNKGKMRLIINVGVSKSDYEAIDKGLSDSGKVISEIIIKDLDTFENELVKNHVKVFSWMIAHEMIEIKVAIIEKETTNKGIFHQKTGVFYDSEGNFVSFSGSDNESANGWVFNIEEFKVFRSWKESELPYLNSDIKRFEKFWKNEGVRTKVIDIPSAVREKFISLCPETEDSLKEAFKEISRKRLSFKKKRELRDYQKDAIYGWRNNSYIGLLEMATGTGKTFTAIAGIKEIYERERKLITIIVVPYQHLATQWIEEMSSSGFESDPAFGSSAIWKKKIKDKILDIEMGHINKLIIVTTYDTFSSEKFIKIMQESDIPILIVCDEAHVAGSTRRSKGLLDKYRYRLALTATPRRWLDDEGTEVIYSYFNKTVFEFPLKNAIGRFLTPYNYFPHLVNLKEEELREYRHIGQRIAILLGKKNQKSKETLELLLIKRAKIVTNAIEKIDMLVMILESIEKIESCLIFCSEKQIKEVKDLLMSKGIRFHQFTNREKLKERKSIKENFEKGLYDVLVAIRCLDEGVDIPSIKTAIILASSSNPKEYIQRRGRVLRKFPGKTKAIIHDFIVVPDIDENANCEYYEVEKKILAKELKRYEEFADASLNPLQSIRIINKIRVRYNL